jgi:hypothetical protein
MWLCSGRFNHKGRIGRIEKPRRRQSAFRRLFFSPVEAVDIDVLVELFDEARVDEVLGLGGFRFRVLKGELVQYRFQPIESGILFGGRLVLVGAFLLR